MFLHAPPPPLPAYADQLIAPGAPSQAALLLASSSSSSAAAAAPPPRIPFERLVHPSDAFRCVAGCGYVPTNVARLDCTCILCVECRRQIRARQPNNLIPDDEQVIIIDEADAVSCVCVQRQCGPPLLCSAAHVLTHARWRVCVCVCDRSSNAPRAGPGCRTRLRPTRASWAPCAAS